MYGYVRVNDVGEVFHARDARSRRAHADARSGDARASRSVWDIARSTDDGARDDDESTIDDPGRGIFE